MIQSIYFTGVAVLILLITECVAVCILVTLIDHPELHLINPFDPDNTILVSTFPDALGLLGIAEFQPDQFAVVVGNWSDIPDATTPHSYSVWQVDMRPFLSQYDKLLRPAVVRKVTDIPPALFLNGLTLLNWDEEKVLVCDSGLGAVWIVDIVTGDYHIAI
jgi:hypothetical protein